MFSLLAEQNYQSFVNNNGNVCRAVRLLKTKTEDLAKPTRVGPDSRLAPTACLYNSSVFFKDSYLVFLGKLCMHPKILIQVFFWSCDINKRSEVMK